ncbi:thioredoxin domain-containing protein [Terasakiella sp. SH-1]|uniref:thioredoxin domain-containing protein n=1 Tax=Terasakiella sp. SH-1 TaxID=2560057 RepID=UPI001073BB7D|nr:thioredoxin domain-containing protein [Terasakiella sp. SH-1]
MSHNELGTQTSPYLLQHADNPVHWKAWSEDVFAQAQELNKPVLLSVGYAACHWCHVMAHESFEDIETAHLMNDLFINVKVDREEHPDVDALYQKALSVMGQQGGWPLTVFLTPSGHPFWGGTYFPLKALYGRPSFKDVLQSISNVFHTQKEDVAQNVEAISGAIAEEAMPKGNGQMTIKNLTDLVGSIHQALDSDFGGLTGAPKFPQPVLFDFFWRANWLKKDKKIEDLIHLSLEQMCLGGIYDHLSGGFARYSTDQEWLVPHFEKMLYDNALLVSLLTMVWRKHPEPLFKRTIEETIGWAIEEMTIRTPKGAVFAAALDADSEGVEGKFYVWDEHEIDQILGNHSKSFKDAYDVTSRGNWENKNILRRVTPFTSLSDEKTLNKCRRILYQERHKRIAPARDDKVLLDWNAMMVKALCEAGLVFEREDWIKRAEESYHALLDIMDHSGKELHHSWCNGITGAKAYLEDYTNLGMAALALYEVTGKEEYFKNAKTWAELLFEQFLDPKSGAYTMSSRPTVAQIEIQQKPVHDNATPSGNGLMANLLVDLYHLSGEEKYKERFEKLLTAFGSPHPNDIFGMPGLCSALLRFEKMETIAILGTKTDKETKSLIKKASYYPSPSRKLLLGGKQGKIDGPALLKDKKMIDKKPTAYVCQFGTCSLPITSEDEMEGTLSSLPDRP